MNLKIHRKKITLLQNNLYSVVLFISDYRYIFSQAFSRFPCFQGIFNFETSWSRADTGKNTWPEH